MIPNTDSEEMRPLIIATILAAAITTPTQASDLPSVMSAVSEAMSKGYGADCDLSMRPSSTDAYYPCLDIGIYRFVSEYGRVRGFVLVPDQEPFEILVSDAAGSRFTVQGNWTTDLPSRVLTWWGGIGAPAAQPDRAAAAGDALAAYLESLEPPKPEPAPAVVQPAPAQQPHIFYIVPPGYAPPQIPAQTTTPAIPSGLAAPQGGVLLAPGVVGYPVSPTP